MLEKIKKRIRSIVHGDQIKKVEDYEKSLKSQMIKKINEKLKDYTHNNERNNSHIYLQFTDYFIIIEDKKQYDEKKIRIYCVDSTKYTYDDVFNRYDNYFSNIGKTFLAFENNTHSFYKKINTLIENRVTHEKNNKLIEKLPKSILRKMKLNNINDGK
jgi:hypothetical protein